MKRHRRTKLEVLRERAVAGDEQAKAKLVELESRFARHDFYKFLCDWYDKRGIRRPKDLAKTLKVYKEADLRSYKVAQKRPKKLYYTKPR